jgi:predicted homoserine dehydrogenase-like protein
MIIVDSALRELESSGTPIRVGIVGAGFMSQGLANQIVNSVPGMRLAAVAGRRLERAAHVVGYAGLEPVAVDSADALEASVAGGRTAITTDPLLLCRAPGIDVIVEATGAVEYATHVVLEAFAHGKDVVLMNAELDATIGPILQVKACEHGVIMSACDGDEPGVQLNLVRWVRGLGLVPRVVGNVKGLQDPYRNPTTQQGWAERWGQNAAMVTSFADGTKISCEQSIVANATGFRVLERGMSRGREFRELPEKLPELYLPILDEIRALGGIIDYTVGTIGTKVFVLAEHPDPKQRHYLELYKMGPGPLYAFWVPYHLVHFEVPNAIARVRLFRDQLAPPLGGPVVEVCAVAKRDLVRGETLDEYGNYMTYGEAVNSDEMRREQYLAEGLVEGCVLRRDIRRDEVIRYGDVVLPAGRLADELRAEQYRHFVGADPN